MKGLKHFQNKTLETLLTEMCKRVNVDPDDIDFNESIDMGSGFYLD